MEDADFDDFFDGLSDEETEEIIQFLVDNGAAVWDGMDQYGERMFKFNMDVLSVVMPALYQQIMEDVDLAMLDLFQKGLVDIEYNENLEANFKVSEAAKAELEAMGLTYLTEEEE